MSLCCFYDVFTGYVGFLPEVGSGTVPKNKQCQTGQNHLCSAESAFLRYMGGLKGVWW